MGVRCWDCRPNQYLRFQGKKKDIRCENLLITDTHDTATAAEAIVEAAKVDGADAELAQDRGTHDAWLYSDVQVGLLEN